MSQVCLGKRCGVINKGCRCALALWTLSFPTALTLLLRTLGGTACFQMIVRRRFA